MLDLDLLRGKLEDAVAQVFEEVQRLRSALAAAEQAYHICEQHQPEVWEGDGTCVICEGHRLAAEVERLKAETQEAFSRIWVALQTTGIIGDATGDPSYAISDVLTEIKQHAEAETRRRERDAFRLGAWWGTQRSLGLSIVMAEVDRRYPLPAGEDLKR